MHKAFFDERLVWLSWALISAPCAFAQAPPCFASVSDFMTAEYGGQFRDDENLRIKETVFGKTSFTIVQDLTSGTNHSRVLLRTNAGSKICVVLRTPPVAQFEMVKADDDGVPQEFRTTDQAPPGMASMEILYRRINATDYAPAVCSSVMWRGKRSVKTQTKCETQ